MAYVADLHDSDGQVFYPSQPSYGPATPTFINGWVDNGASRVDRVGNLVILQIDITLKTSYPANDFGISQLPSWAIPTTKVSGAAFTNNSGTWFAKDLQVTDTGLLRFGRVGSDVGNSVKGQLTYRVGI